MTDLTPERRAELRVRAAKPFVVHDFVAPPFTTIDAADLHALLDAADERDRLAAAVERVRALHVADGEGFCGVCDYMTPHPCPTIRALDGRHE